MPDVVKHGWTHRPRSQGGTDPVVADLRWVWAFNQSHSQTVTTTDELEFTDVRGVGIYQEGTSESGTFSLDLADPKGILIAQPGLYMAHAEVHYDLADAADARYMYIAWSLASNGPLGSAGDNVNPAMGLSQSSTGSAEVTTIGKLTLSYWCIAALTRSPQVSVAAPYRMAVVLHHSGANYGISGSITSNLTVVQLSAKNNSFVDFSP